MIKSNGEWWDYSWNIAPGCTKVGPECDNCWALAMARRLEGMRKKGYEGLVTPTPAHPQMQNTHFPKERGQIGRGARWTGKVNLLYEKLREPADLKKPRVIAVNLMGDLFHANVPDSFILQVFEAMGMCDWHTFMVLTKRPERMLELAQAWTAALGKGALRAPRSFIWLGTTAGTQLSANRRWGAMARLAELGWNTWVSSEPRLEGIDWHGWEFLKLLVTGGESGPYARPMSPAWPRTDRDWCVGHGVEFHFKQWGEWAPIPDPSPISKDRNGGKELLERNCPATMMGNEMVWRLGRKAAGRVLDGCVWDSRIVR